MQLEHLIENVLESSAPYFLLVIIILHIIMFLIFIGIVYINPEWIIFINTGFRYFICIFLIIRFRPFKKHDLRKYDGKIIFAAAILLLSNELLEGYLSTYINKTLQPIMNINDILHPSENNII